MEALWPYRSPERAAHGSKRKRPYVCKAGIGSPVHGGELPPVFAYWKHGVTHPMVLNLGRSTAVSS
jgi:hypothetical protein